MPSESYRYFDLDLNGSFDMIRCCAACPRQTGASFTHLHLHTSAYTPPFTHLHLHTSTYTPPFTHLHLHTSIYTPLLTHLHLHTSASEGC